MVILWTFSENIYSECKWCMTTNVKFGACRSRPVSETSRILTAMDAPKRGRPHKGNRQAIKTESMDATLKSQLVARAKHHGLDYGPYVADLLALDVGRPDLVHDLDIQTLDLDIDVKPEPCDNPNYFLTRPAREVHAIISQRAAKERISLGKYVIRFCEDHIRKVMPTDQQEVLPIGA